MPHEKETFTLWDRPSDGKRFGVRLAFDRVGGRLECVEVRITSHTGSRPTRPRPVTASDLRTIPLGQLVDHATKPLRLEVVETEEGVSVAFKVQGRKDRQRQPDDPHRLALVAKCYEEGGRRPVAFVAEVFHLTHSGAAKLVGRARRAGYLTMATSRQVGGRMTAKAQRVFAGEEKQ